VHRNPLDEPLFERDQQVSRVYQSVQDGSFPNLRRRRQ
jgi:hypothetical protein